MKKLFFILGMHRSGTSALTRMLNLAGIDIGDHLMGSAPDNPKGFFEDNDAVNINDSLLLACKSSWHGAKAIDFTNPETTFKKNLNEIQEFLIDRFSNRSAYGLKDPRLCRTLPLWQQAIDNLGIEGQYILTARNPLEVAASLKKRNRLPTTRSVDMWLRYSLGAERHTRGMRRVIVCYDTILKDPAGCLAKISDSLEVPLDTSAGTMREINHFLDAGLRHSYFGREELEHHPYIAEPVIRMHDAFLTNTFPASAVMDKWSEDLDKKYPPSLDERRPPAASAVITAWQQNTLINRLMRLACQMIPMARIRRKLRKRIAGKSWNVCQK